MVAAMALLAVRAMTNAPTRVSCDVAVWIPRCSREWRRSRDRHARQKTQSYEKSATSHEVPPARGCRPIDLLLQAHRLAPTQR